MGRKVEILPANIGHIMQIAPYVRQCDRDEVWAQTHLDVAEALEMALGQSPETTFSCHLDGKVVAIFGVVEDVALSDTTSRAGILWMLATNDIYEHVGLFHEHTAAWLEYYRGQFDYIANWVDARNTAAVKWIAQVGFTVHDPVPHGPDGLPFHYFEWRAT